MTASDRAADSVRDELLAEAKRLLSATQTGSQSSPEIFAALCVLGGMRRAASEGETRLACDALASMLRDHASVVVESVMSSFAPQTWLDSARQLARSLERYSEAPDDAEEDAQRIAADAVSLITSLDRALLALSSAKQLFPEAALHGFEKALEACAQFARTQSHVFLDALAWARKQVDSFRTIGELARDDDVLAESATVLAIIVDTADDIARAPYMQFNYLTPEELGITVAAEPGTPPSGAAAHLRVLRVREGVALAADTRTGPTDSVHLQWRSDEASWLATMEVPEAAPADELVPLHIGFPRRSAFDSFLAGLAAPLAGAAAGLIVWPATGTRNAGRVRDGSVEVAGREFQLRDGTASIPFGFIVENREALNALVVRFGGTESSGTLDE